MNPKQKLYKKNLKSYLMNKGGLSNKEAEEASTLAVKALIKQGASFQMGHARKMGEMMMKEKALLDKVK